jgi:hypothetical protein
MQQTQVGLTALSLITPAFPSGSTTLSVDTDSLPLVIQADTSTLTIAVTLNQQATLLTSYTDAGSVRTFTGSIPITMTASAQLLDLVGQNWDATTTPQQYLTTTTLQFTLLTVTRSLGTLIGAPTGVSVYKGTTSCTIEWALPSYTGLMGVQASWSTDASGVTVPYTNYGQPVTLPSRTDNAVLVPPTSSVVNKALGTNADGQPMVQLTTTTVETDATVTYSNVAIPYSTVNADIFYVKLVTLVLDSATNTVYESQAAGPFTCGYVDLSLVNPTDFPDQQSRTSIATRMITEITRRRGALDLSTHAESRDVVINPIAIVLEQQSIRAWFANCARSISALSKIDDADGDGVSDPYASSPNKQKIALVYGMSPTDVQTFIDGRFVILGENAGIQKSGATTSTVYLTFYTYTRPTTSLTIPVGTIAATIADSYSTASVSFVTTEAATMSLSNIQAYWDPVNSWYSVMVTAQAQTAGSSGNVGAGTIRQVTSGAITLAVTNMTASSPAVDNESNASFAARIQNRLVAGKDSGTRLGYWNTAVQQPGVLNPMVVAAGDATMLRDWYDMAERHLFGCVDIYVEGNTFSQQVAPLPLLLPNSGVYGTTSGYLTLTQSPTSALKFVVSNFASLGYTIYTAIELPAVSAGRTVYLGVANAQFDNVNGYVFLAGADAPYTKNADGTTTVWQINGVNATNTTFLAAIGTTGVTFSLFARYQTGISYVPTLQPVVSVDSITGPLTGTITPADIALVHTSDLLLYGGSNQAGDTVSIAASTTNTLTKTLALSTTTTLIDTDMAVAVSAAGIPGNILSVRSTDLSTVYTYGVDYSIVAMGQYRSYGIQLLSGALAAGASVVVAYNQYLLREQPTLQADSLTLSGSTPVPLTQNGLIANAWLPVSHSLTTLFLDGQGSSDPTTLMGADIAPASRYVKVTYTNGLTTALMQENRDFNIGLNAATGVATITRVLGGNIPDGATVSVLYYYGEVLSITTEYPAYVQQVVAAVSLMQHASASVLVKAKVSSGIDMTFTVYLDGTVDAATIDPLLRNAISLRFSRSSTLLYQTPVISGLQAISGVAGIQLPLQKFARADGTSNIAELVPTGTVWAGLALDPSFSGYTVPNGMFISASPLLSQPTIPSGGTSSAYVGLLYEGTPYRRASTITDFLTGLTPSFYIVGTGDTLPSGVAIPTTYPGKILIAPPAGVDPSSLSFRVTYQVWGASSAQDIQASYAEYLVPGSIQIFYASGD